MNNSKEIKEIVNSTHLSLDHVLVPRVETSVVAVEEIVHLVRDPHAVYVLIIEAVGAHPDT